MANSSDTLCQSQTVKTNVSSSAYPHQAITFVANDKMPVSSVVQQKQIGAFGEHHMQSGTPAVSDSCGQAFIMQHAQASQPAKKENPASVFASPHSHTPFIFQVNPRAVVPVTSGISTTAPLTLASTAVYAPGGQFQFAGIIPSDISKENYGLLTSRNNTSCLTELSVKQDMSSQSNNGSLPDMSSNHTWQLRTETSNQSTSPKMNSFSLLQLGPSVVSVCACLRACMHACV